MNNYRIREVHAPLKLVYVAAKDEAIPDHWVPCILDVNLKFNPHVLATHFFKSKEYLVHDAFTLAAAIEFCDYTKARPKNGWARLFKLSVPVNDPEHWKNEKVLSPLIKALNIVTGDQWQIEFRKRTSDYHWPKQSDLNLDNKYEAVMAYSDGMDSLSVAEIISNELNNDLVKIRLGKKGNKRANKYLAVPYKVNYNSDPRESSGRSRGFKFSILSGSAAYLSKTERIIVPESGQGALGPALVPVSRAAIDYRNHPIYFKHIREFLSALFERNFSIEIPRLWFTKGETLSEYIKITNDNTRWRETRSCWRGQRQTSVDGTYRQCGICAACLLRRMSVHAAGQIEPSETFLWEDLNVSNFKDGAARDTNTMHDFAAHHKYAIGAMAHLRDMAEIRNNPNEKECLKLHAGQIARAMDMNMDDVLSRQADLLAKHEDEWHSFLNSLKQNSFLAKWAKGSYEDAA